MINLAMKAGGDSIAQNSVLALLSVLPATLLMEPALVCQDTQEIAAIRLVRQERGERAVLNCAAHAV